MKHITIIEDDAGIMDSMSITLRNSGYTVTSYPNGNAIINGRFTPPDLFIIDRQLSGVDGIDVGRFLKQQPATSHIPIIMMSATPSIVALAKGIADDTLEKPFSIHTLREMVAKHLGA